MFDLAGIHTGDRVLDVAAGSGAQTILAARRVGPAGFVLATDISPQMLAFAEMEIQNAGLTNVETQVMDAQNLDLTIASVMMLSRAIIVAFAGKGLRGRRYRSNIMRILFTTQPAASHWYQLVPLAQALESAGHEVAFASTPGFCPTIEAKGFRSFRAGADETEEEARQIWEQIAGSEELPPQVPAMRYWFAGIRADRTLPDLLHIIRDWRPDIVVREHTEFAGCVAAERAGIPHATYQLAAPALFFFRAVEEPLNRLLASVGLPSGTPGMPADTLYRFLLLYPRPLSLWNPEVPVPDTMHVFRYSGFNQSGDEALPEWVGQLGELEERPNGQVERRPTVYATLGTTWNNRTDILTAILGGLREEPINLILTVGRNRDPLEFGEQPAHVHVESYIPQDMLLPLCDLVVTHGGSGTMMDALSLGLPMVIIPISADQPVNAQLCTELGVARVVTPDGRTEQELAQEIRNAAQEVLRDRAYRENAQRLQKEMEELPGLEYPVALLETLATEHTEGFVQDLT